ncbi:MAG: oxidoreductase [Verrucomicrobiota bacterium]
MKQSTFKSKQTKKVNHQNKGKNMSKKIENKVVLITGASTGFGRSLTEAALEQGHRVVATARKREALQDLTTGHRQNILGLELDVTNRTQIRSVVEEAVSVFGKMDVLINNAGFGMIGAVEEFHESEVRDQFETNVFGAIWMIQEILPYMRQQQSGHIINISSVAGHVGYAGSGLYAASKHALEGLSQGLFKEVESLGIHVTMVNPGPFRTQFAGSSLKTAEKKIEAYATSVHTRQAYLRNNLNGNQAGDPDRAARAILETVGLPKPPFTLPLGAIAFEEIPGRLQNTLDEIEAIKAIGLPTDYETEPQKEKE